MIKNIVDEVNDKNLKEENDKTTYGVSEKVQKKMTNWTNLVAIVRLDSLLPWEIFILFSVNLYLSLIVDF